MRNNKAKEQLIAILTLASVFIFIIYLKMNPEINANSFSADQHKINTIVSDASDDINNINNISTKNDNHLDNIPVQDNAETIQNNSIITFTERELNRAMAYQDRNWKMDGTINMAAWDYVLNNPNFKQEREIDSNLDVVDIVK
tara:strand:- start:284 stop:712 length:429 start_codon:yes stop_codon:yes gene_type:complete